MSIYKSGSGISRPRIGTPAGSAIDKKWTFAGHVPYTPSVPRTQTGQNVGTLLQRRPGRKSLRTRSFSGKGTSELLYAYESNKDARQSNSTARATSKMADQ